MVGCSRHVDLEMGRAVDDVAGSAGGPKHVSRHLKAGSRFARGVGEDLSWGAIDASATPLETRGRDQRRYMNAEHPRVRSHDPAVQMISISRGTHSRGGELAHRLAEKMGYACLSREDLFEAAVEDGIQVGKLEMAMIKPHAFSERLARERDHYLAFCRTFLSERAMAGDLVYHGRNGHLLLPGISHILRVRVVWDLEHRIYAIMQKMGVEREKARRYVQEVDEDRRRWVRSMYSVAVEEAINYDFTVNLQQVSVESAASALVGAAQLPDFQTTPASSKAIRDLHLGSKARLELARDERTFMAGFKVRADAGVVTVGYLPQDARIAEHIPAVLESIPEIHDLRITMATTNLLWIQEEFRPRSEVFDEVVEIATKWNAAVELVRLAPEDDAPSEETESASVAVAEESGSGEYDGGIEADVPDDARDDGGLRETLDRLAEVGRSGGGRVVYGGGGNLLETLDRSVPYTLVVIGDVFLSKGQAARLRAMRDLRGFLGDRIRTPVVTADELGSEYLFRRRDILHTAFFVAVVALIYLLVFTNQEAVLAFMAHGGWYSEAVRNTFLGRYDWMPKVLVSVALFLFIPVVAYSYGRVTSALLKLIKME